MTLLLAPPSQPSFQVLLPHLCHVDAKVFIIIVELLHFFQNALLPSKVIDNGGLNMLYVVTLGHFDK